MMSGLTRTKRLSRSVLIVAAMLVALMVPAVVWPTASVSANHCTSNTFLTFPHWYRGIVTHDDRGDCVVSLKNPPRTGDVDLNRIWIVVLNITDMMLQVVGYIAAGFVLYGGIRYLISNGNPDDISKARDIILKAMIGMVLAISAAAIVGFIVGNIRG
jgi:hypothetical protein